MVAGVAVVLVSSLGLAGCGGSAGHESTAQPGSGLIAYEKDDGIYVANPDGSGQRRLTPGKRDTAPRWAPDGRELAFLAKRDGRWDLYVVRPDGSGERRLTHTAAEEMDAEWAPNGLSLALVTKRGGEHVLELVERAGGTPSTVVSGVAGDDFPAWSPDSSRLAVVRRGSITIVDLAGHTRDLVRGATPSWSPDGERIAFTRGSQIYVVGVDGSGERPLGPDESISVVPRFSPDGATLAYETITGADILSGMVAIAVTSSDGSDTNVVVTDAADFPPVWSPDGSRLLYIRSVDEQGFVNYDVCAVRLADGQVTVIAGSDDPEYVGPAAWQRLPSET